MILLPITEGMKLDSKRSTGGLAVLTGISGVVGSYVVTGLTASFIASPIESALARRMPGMILTFAISTLGNRAQWTNLVLAISLSVILLGGLTIGVVLVGMKIDGVIAAMGLTIIVSWTVSYLLTEAPVAAIGTGLAPGLVVILHMTVLNDTDTEAVSSARRRIIKGGIATIATGGAYTLIPSLRFPRDESNGDPTSKNLTTDNGGVETIEQELLSVAKKRSLEVENLAPLVSRDFYEVDINAINPTVKRRSWTLSVTGKVGQEKTYGFQDISRMPSEQRFETLRCVGDPLNGKKMDTALWTTTPISELLYQVKPTSDCSCVVLRAVDGYYEEFPISALRNGALAYRMNGGPLPPKHGYPVRALIPGHWGEISVKWLTEIEFLRREITGYWEKRGWHGTGPVTTVAKLHVVNHLEGNRVQIGGHAYAGTRGIMRVEVSIDGGKSWTDAQLNEPLPGIDVWRQWSYTFQPRREKHRVVVRAVDGDGTLQPKEPSSAIPDGASGWVNRMIRR